MCIGTCKVARNQLFYSDVRRVASAVQAVPVCKGCLSRQFHLSRFDIYPFPPLAEKALITCLDTFIIDVYVQLFYSRDALYETFSNIYIEILKFSRIVQ